MNDPHEPSPPPSTTGEVASEEKTMGMLCHLLALAGFVGVPLGNILGPLIIWLIQKDKSAFVNDQGKESLNFQITVLIAILICIPLMFVLIGFILMPIIAIAALVFVIIGAINAANGTAYRYPVALRLIK